MEIADERRRWLALLLLCIGDLMIVLDTTIVNVALPSIRDDLAFGETSLVWVVNAYVLTYGGFMLLGGRLADFYGRRRLFLAGVALFTLASVACGVANSQVLLIVARAVQGLGGAVVTAVALSLIMTLFTGTEERAKAMAVYGFVMAAGGSIGVLLGGVLTGLLDWHWIFLVNLPLGIAVFAWCLRLLPPDEPSDLKAQHDLAGATTITLALLLAVYAIVDGQDAGWDSLQTIGTLVLSALLFAAFLVIETRAAEPLVPLRLFRLRTLVVANVVGVLWAASMFGWFFLSALYMQRVLGYDALAVGLAFLPTNLVMGAFSLGVSAWTVTRFGLRAPLAVGMLLATVGLATFALAPADGTFLANVLPGMLLLGLGAGMAFNPVLIAAMDAVDPHESGLASGVVNTSFMMGGALGLAVLVAAAAAVTDAQLAQGIEARIALNAGYQWAFWLATALSLLATLLALLLPARASESTLAAGGH